MCVSSPVQLYPHAYYYPLFEVKKSVKKKKKKINHVTIVLTRLPPDKYRMDIPIRCSADENANVIVIL